MRDLFLKELKAIYDHQKLPERIYALEKEIKSKGINDNLVTRYSLLGDELVTQTKMQCAKQ